MTDRTRGEGQIKEIAGVKLKPGILGGVYDGTFVATSATSPTLVTGSRDSRAH